MGRGRLAAIGIAVAVAAFVTSSCASTRSTDWTNQNISEVVKKLGQPTEVARSPEGTTYVWRQTRTSVSSDKGFDDPHNGFDTSPYCLIRWFSADGNGTILHYRVDKMPGICGSTPLSNP